ncbi:MAG TPA: hypothetical protein VFA80_18130 [Xanthobacteraceae bacterium]|nr:hypothetical protein [Xanthobacteraceae bacterium]
MKFVHSIQGASALHVAVDEVVPLKGLVSEDLIRLVGDTYKFAVKPQIPPGMAPGLMVPHVFQSGSVTLEDAKFPVYQLIILQMGDIVVGPDTDTSDKILGHYMNLLDTQLEYRFDRSSTKRISHQSHVVVDFDDEIGRKMAAIGKLERLLDEHVRAPGAPFNLRRLAFGSSPAILQTQPMTLEAFDRMDFVIERRAINETSNPPNRYYSGAPLDTSAHLSLLELLERELDQT